jgi:tyrosyl-tRNA synthetase
VTFPLLVGTDGEEKMSKSRGNYIGITEPPEEMFGKTMSIPDRALPQWWEMLVGEERPPDEAMEWKLELARTIVRRWHSDDAARTAEEHFTHVVREGLVPDEVPEATLPSGDPVHLPAVLASTFGLSTSDARRLIAQGGVKVDGDVVDALDVPRASLSGRVLRAGKRRFARLVG